MKINTLRQLDYWIGRPICGILTVAYKLKKMFIKKGQIKTPDKILFIKLFGIGSVVLSLPTINAVKKKYPDSSIYFLTFKGNESVLTLTDTIPVQNIVTVRTDRMFNFLVDIFRAFFKFISENIYVVIDLEFFSRFTAIFSFFVRSKYRIGFYGFHAEGLKRGSFIDFQINYNHTLHTSQAFFTLLQPLGINQGDYDPALPQIPPKDFHGNVMHLIKRDNENCRSDFKQWVVMNPNSSDLSIEKMA